MSPNVKQAVPFFSVSNNGASVHYYVDGLGFEMTNSWKPNGVLRWCWLELSGAAMMLQQFSAEGPDAWAPEGKVGEGVSVYFIRDDALELYRQFSCAVPPFNAAIGRL